MASSAPEGAGVAEVSSVFRVLHFMLECSGLWLNLVERCSESPTKPCGVTFCHRGSGNLRIGSFSSWTRVQVVSYGLQASVP